MAYVLINDNSTGKRVREEFDPEMVEFRPPRVLDHGGKIIGLTYKGGPLRIQTPELNVPYGVNVNDTPAGEHKYSIQFSFRGEEENERIAKFHEQMRGLQAKLVRVGTDNSLAWFKKKMSTEVVSEFFTPILKVSKDKETGEPNGKYPDTFKVNLDLRNGEFVCKAFSMDHAPLDEPLDSLIVKGSRATALIIPSFLWFAGGKFGLTIKAEQMRVKVPARSDRYGFVDDEAEDSEYPVGGESASSVVKSQLVDDDDEEDEDEAEPDVPAPAPAPVPAAVSSSAGSGGARGRRTRKNEE
jgi:hypothetical protein